VIFAVATLLAFVVSDILNRLKDLKELQEKSTIENIQFEIESGLADLAEKIQKFNDEVADWDDDNQKFIQAEMIKMKENLFRSVQMEVFSDIWGWKDFLAFQK